MEHAMNRPTPRQPRRTRSTLRVVGPVLIGIGLVLTVLGMISFFNGFGGGELPGNFWLAFVGLPLLIVGAAISLFAFLGPATSYVAGEVTPVIRDSLSTLGIGSAGRTCASCGAQNDGRAQFCDSCGKPLET